tara:strand:+ start:189 stop:2444 length:2256 start_codon:yes stop_codon:yes gene_type:complete
MSGLSALKNSIKEDNIYNKTTSSKGAVCLSSTESLILDLFTGVRPGIDLDNIKSLMDKIITTGDINTIVNMFVILFFKRAIKEEGRRDEPRAMFLHLYNHYQKETLMCLPFFIKFGYWYDLINIWRDVCSLAPENHRLPFNEIDYTSDSIEEFRRYYEHWNPLIQEIIRLFMTQIDEDIRELDVAIIEKRHPRVSLCAKWITSENSRDNDLYDKRAMKRSEKRKQKYSKKNELGLKTHIKTFADKHNIKDISIIPSNVIEKLTRNYAKKNIRKNKFQKGKIMNTERKLPIWWYIPYLDGPKFGQYYMVESIVNMFIRFNHDETRRYTDIQYSEKKKYRKNNSRLREVINVLESNMCTNKWDRIELSKLPGKAFQKNKKAIFNEIVVPPGKKPIKLRENEAETGNRKPHDPLRVDLRKRCKVFLSDAKNSKLLNTKCLTPVDVFYSMKSVTSDLEKRMLEMTWREMINETYESICEVASVDPKRIKRIIPMPDLSGSMESALPGVGSKKSSIQRTVMDAALSLSILAAKARPKDDPLRLTMVGFSSDPMVFHISEDSTLDENIREIQEKTKGNKLNTDFYKAVMSLLRKIASLVRAGRMKADEITQVVLAVFTDLQFDYHSCPGYDPDWNTTTYERLVREAARMGLPGIPTIAFWNLNTFPNGTQADSNKHGVEYYQGYSKNNIRHLFYGDDESDSLVSIEVEGQKILVSKTTALDKMNIIINNENFDVVRELFSSIKTGIFSSYNYESKDE